jgi:hypothetical protein
MPEIFVPSYPPLASEIPIPDTILDRSLGRAYRPAHLDLLKTIFERQARAEIAGYRPGAEIGFGQEESLCGDVVVWTFKVGGLNNVEDSQTPQIIKTTQLGPTANLDGKGLGPQNSIYFVNRSKAGAGLFWKAGYRKDQVEGSSLVSRPHLVGYMAASTLQRMLQVPESPRISRRAA